MSVRTFCILGLFSWTFCHHGRFATTDVLSPRMFCHHGRFVATDVMTPDVLTLRMLCDERFVTGRFVTGRFVGESAIRPTTLHTRSFKDWTCFPGMDL
jgi:hypothetical protein